MTKTTKFSFLRNNLFLFGILIILIAYQTSSTRVALFATSLAPQPKTQTRREVLSSLLSSSSTMIGTTAMYTAGFVGILATPTVDGTAQAAIDVSGLRVENPATTDVFLGGTYYPDDEEDRDGVDGRVTRMKYNIELSGTGFAGYRLIKVKRVSSTISSSRDDFVELPGMVFECPGGGSSGDSGVGGSRQRQCITIDFSPTGGPRDVQGYWDEKENGIRFVLDNKLWSKQ